MQKIINCLRCDHYKTSPKKIGETGKCTKYPNGISKAIFFNGKKCAYSTVKNIFPQ